VAAGFLLLAQPLLAAGAETLTVDPNNASCGDPSNDTYCSIQNAIDSASPGAVIRISAGEFDLWGEALQIDKDLILRGAGADKTILDGGGDNPRPLITISESVSVEISGLNLINRVRSGSRDMGPGAIDHNGDDLRINDVFMRDNQGGWGGAVRLRSEFGEIEFKNVVIENNSAFAGAGIAFYDGPGAKLTITNSTIRKNSAVFSGGAIFLRDLSELEMVSVNLTENRTGNTGGGMHVFSQTSNTQVSIDDSKITGNISGGTGGISVMGDDVQIKLERTILSSNTSEDDPAKSDCSAGREGMFVSKGNNRIGIGDGCLLQSAGGDFVGSVRTP